MSALESEGIPTVTICTSQFAYEASEQWRALGYRGTQVVEVRHPFGHLPREAVLAEAHRIVDEVLDVLTGRADAAGGTGAQAVGGNT